MPKPATTSIARAMAAWRKPLRTSGLLSVLGVCVASPLAVISLLGASAATGQTTAFGVPPGATDDGRALPAQVAQATSSATPAPAHGLQLRRGCRWGQPGRLPYQGSTRQALQAAGLPAEVVEQIDRQRTAGQRSGRLVISRNGIRHTGDGRVFPARGLALTFGMTLCRDASVNFVTGHEEPADLYEARDHQGRPYAVMVPDVCGNVTVLGAAGGPGRVAGAAATLARRAQGLAALADALDPPSAGMATAAPAGSMQAGAPADGSGDAGAAPDSADAGGTQQGSDGDGAAANADAAASAAGSSGATAQRRRPGGVADASVPASGDTGAGPGGGVMGGTAGLSGNTGGAAPGVVDPGTPAVHRAPPVLVAAGAVTGLLVPAQAAAGVVRQIGRVTASAGQGLETVSAALGAPATTSGGSSAGTQPVPEPGTLPLAVLALLAMAGLKRRR